MSLQSANLEKNYWIVKTKKLKKYFLETLFKSTVIYPTMNRLYADVLVEIYKIADIATISNVFTVDKYISKTVSKYIRKHNKIQTMITYNLYYLKKYVQIKSFKRMVSRFEYDCRAITDRYVNVFYAVLKNKKTPNTRQNKDDLDDIKIEECLRVGAIKNAQWLEKQGCNPCLLVYEYAFEYCCIKSIQWLYNCGYPLQHNRLDKLVEYRAFDILEWLRGKISFTGLPQIAIINNDFEMLKWLEANGVKPFGTDYIYATKNLEILNWLYDNNYCVKDNFTTRTIYCDAVSNNNMELLEWLKQRDFPLTQTVFFCAAKQGKIHILEWLKANGCQPVNFDSADYPKEVKQWLRRNVKTEGNDYDMDCDDDFTVKDFAEVGGFIDTIGNSKYIS